MKENDIFVDETMESLLGRFFVKDGCLIPRYDDQGADAGLTIWAQYDDPKNLACPYCGGADNILEKENIGGHPLTSKSLDGGDPCDVTTDGFRCASCNRKWAMLRFNKCMAVAVGYESEKSKGRPS